MEYDVLITALKVVGIIVGSALGIAGVLFNFKSDDGRLTKSGIAVIGGILVSSAIGVIGSVVEGHKAQLEAFEQTSQIYRLLAELNRSIHPITKLDLTYWIKLPDGHKLVKETINEMNLFVDGNLPQLLDFRSTALRDTMAVTATDIDETPITVTVQSKSALWPKNALGSLASSFSFIVFISKTPMHPQEFRALMSTEDADFIAPGLPLNGQNQLDLNIPKQELYIFGRQETTKSLWKNSGRISTIPDLYGSQLFLLPPYSSDYGLAERYNRSENGGVVQLAKSVEIGTVVIEVADGREIWIDGDRFEKTKYKSGFPVFSVILPKTDEGMRGLYSGD